MKTEKPLNVSTLKLGVSGDLLETETSEDCRELTLLMAAQAQRRVRIVSRHLDPALFDTEPFVEAIRQMLLRTHRGRVEILVPGFSSARQRWTQVFCWSPGSFASRRWCSQLSRSVRTMNGILRLT